ncbi:MAG: HutD/Ves family protein [Vogesella sp.]|uniref:HutD/Ves family protein n=1 Tax=Vogesella sp. TaxID=1904252 RepID=UPI003F2CC366
MHIIRLQDCPPSTWKNGGGSTRQLLAYPPGASLDSFTYRVSVAEVDSDGPFSHFAGVDRSLAILAGDGLVLMKGAQLYATLRPGDAPLAFDGGLPLAGLRLAGKVRDFNVMTRQGLASHDCQSLQLAAGQHQLAVAPHTLLFVAQGETVLAGSAELGKQDALWLTEASTLTLHCSAQTTLLHTRFTLHQGQP